MLNMTNNMQTIYHSPFTKCVMCQVSGVICQVSHITCHLSIVTKPTATATDPPPVNFPIMKSGLKKTKIDEKIVFGILPPIFF